MEFFWQLRRMMLVVPAWKNGWWKQGYNDAVGGDESDSDEEEVDEGRFVVVEEKAAGVTAQATLNQSTSSDAYEVKGLWFESTRGYVLRLHGAERLAELDRRMQAWKGVLLEPTSAQW